MVKTWCSILLAALLAVLGGCGGGGVGEGGTGSVASGPITGFGSIIVGGVRYDASAASVRDDDDAPRSSDELRLGMVVTIQATAVDPATLTARALSIRIAGQVAGPVESVDLAGRSLRVFGQRVLVNAETVFDDRLAAGLAALRPGEAVEVYGFLDRTRGLIVATRIEPSAAAAGLKLRAPVDAIDTSGRTLDIGGQRVSTAGLAPPTGVSTGSWILLRARSSGGTLSATRIDTAGLVLPERDQARLEGRVTAFTSGRSFSVEGVAVDGNGLAAGVALGSRVEIEGTVAGGVVVASRVKVKEGAEEIQLRGNVAGLAPGARSFTLRGLNVVYDAATAFENGTEANLAVGRAVDVRGMLAADGVRVQALRIKFE